MHDGHVMFTNIVAWSTTPYHQSNVNRILGSQDFWKLCWFRHICSKHILESSSEYKAASSTFISRSRTNVLNMWLIVIKMICYANILIYFNVFLHAGVFYRFQNRKVLDSSCYLPFARNHLLVARHNLLFARSCGFWATMLQTKPLIMHIISPSFLCFYWRFLSYFPSQLFLCRWNREGKQAQIKMCYLEDKRFSNVDGDRPSP